MSHDANRSRRSIQREQWRNFLADSDDDLDQMTLMLLVHEETKLKAAQSSSDRTRRRRYLNQDREAGHDRLFSDYFSDQPVYPEEVFRRRFRMQRGLFLRIVNALQNHSEYFEWRVDAIGRRGLSPLQKCTAAIRQLAYGSPADICDEYLRMGETTALDCLVSFCQCVIEVFGPQYLRRSNVSDIQRLLRMHEQRHGFPGMLGSLDWSRNDINVLNESPLFNNVLQGNAPEVNFIVNVTQYTKGYYLTDGIYPEWATFVKSFPCPQDSKRKMFKQSQEAARKDVERAFGVLQSRWAMIRGPGRFWYKNNLKDIMYTCIILHNMIIEDEGDAATNWSDDEEGPEAQTFQGSTREFQEYLRRNCELHDSQVYHQLRAVKD